MTRLSQDDAGQPAVSTTKRRLLKAAWVTPAIVAASLPRSGFAANISGPAGSPRPDNGKGKGDKHGKGKDRKDRSGKSKSGWER